MRIKLLSVVGWLALLTMAHAQDAPAETSNVRVHAAMGEGVVVESTDGRFSVGFRGRIQLRAEVVSSDEDTRVEFMVRRLRFTILGHVFSRDWKYQVQLGVAPLDFEPGLLNPIRDAYLTYSGVRDLNVRVGQMKVPFSRERMTSSGSLQFVDRSFVNAELNLDRDVGAQILSRDFLGAGGRLAYAVGVFGGEGRNRAGADAGLLYAARFEVMPFGEVDATYSQVDLARTHNARLAVSGAVGFNHRSRRLRSTTSDFADTGYFNYLHFAADAVFKFAGFSFEGGVLSRRATHATAKRLVEAASVDALPRNAFGWFAQAGYLFEVPIEVSARYGQIHPLSGADSSLELRREIAAAFSWYPAGHSLKIQLDYTLQFGSAIAADLHDVRLQTQIAY